MSNFTYDLMLWIFSIVLDLFFREVHPRSSWKIPKKGPVLFVAAPHANQFLDPLILGGIVRREAKRRIAFLIAEKSMRRKFVGWASAQVGALPVGRALDSTKAVPGKIYLPDPEGDPTLVRGVGTKFDHPDFQVGGLLVLPTISGQTGSSEIMEIMGPEEIRVKKPFKGEIAIKQLTGKGPELEGEKNEGEKGEFQGTNFKVAPKVDQNAVYDAVFEKLNSGGCVGIFPEGGSHDRTELLPLKAGVAIMALGALAVNPDSGLKIIPCGMNYFHPHKFRSRAVVEFGTPVEVSPEIIELYKNNERRESVGRLLEEIHEALVAVTVTSPDYDTLMMIQAVRRLYKPKGKKLPLPMVVELNRRLVKGYTRYKDDERIIKLKKAVIEYNKELLALNIRDHQVEYAQLPLYKVIAYLLFRIGKILLLTAGVLPGLVMFAPVFIVGKRISILKAREALAGSTVKIQGKDVMATWKLLVSLALAPVLYAFYTFVLLIWAHKNRVQGYYPENYPIWPLIPSSWVLFSMITYAALRFGEIGMDIFKSLRPLVLSLRPGNTLFKLRQKRAALAAEVTDVINTLGPEMFPDFDSARIVADPSVEAGTEEEAFFQRSPVYEPDSQPASPITEGQPGASLGGGSSYQGHLPRNESFGNLGNFGFFASRPTTPNHARSRSRNGSTGGFKIQGFSTIDSQADFDTVSQKIRTAMKERGQRRRSAGQAEFELATSEPSTPGTPKSEYNKKDA
ncbi:putative glycerol-3-phosphate O-acyltransferase [Aulographum hederae CBS 113979]|uniref:Putative glycerol-3-phosphate O-acyltransferase n=1 Tax=Aulographum hederae CBS 113979 TaxID=1176131 RepID=A0A6G1HFT7_9PEZI|nr:putative glycerol-3-phosphate O-acyltransferase [Aulographum hederae CBS 113979]